MSSTVAPRLHLGDAASSVRLRSAFYVVIDRHAGAVTTAVHASTIAHDILLVSFFDSEDEVIKQINAFQPHRLTSYASGVARLAELALEGRLAVSPQQIVVSGDRLTAQMETKIREAWNAPIYNVYAASSYDGTVPRSPSSKVTGRTSCVFPSMSSSCVTPLVVGPRMT